MSSVLKYKAFSKIAQNATFPTASLCKTPFLCLCDLTFCDITCHSLTGELHKICTSWHQSENMGQAGGCLSAGVESARQLHSSLNERLKIGQEGWKNLSCIPVRKALKSRSGRFIIGMRMKCLIRSEISTGSGFSSAVWISIQ